MKYLYLIILTLALFCSCEDELELKSPSTLTFAGFWDNEDGAKAAHTGLYGAFRGKVGTFWGLGELRSDIWGGNTLETPSSMSVIENKISTSQVPYSKWGGFYTLIHKLNDFIQNVPAISFQKETEKNHMLGQVYGMRAYVYYTMLKTWGDVPITTEPQLTIDPSNTSKERSLKSDVMNLVKEDIKKSLEYFGDNGSYWMNKRLYWSKAATLTLKGEVYIWSGTHLGGGNSDYTAAKTALESVATLDVELLVNYTGLWGTSNESNKEFIFSVDYTIDESTNFFSSMTGRGTEVNPLFNSAGGSMNDFITNGANRYGPSEKVLIATDDALDSRKEATFMRLFIDDNGGAGYSNYDSDKYSASLVNKFIGSVSSGVRKADSDFPIYRYADVILLIAEAKNLLGEDPSSEINTIRQRAYGTNYNAATHEYSNGTKTANTKAILDERLKEFIAEGKRWWDLRRAGDSYVFENVETLSADNAYLLELPITVDMIGRNPLLKQTTGYPE